MNDIKKIVAYYKRKTGTSDPFILADRLGILYQFCDLNFDGCYMFLKNHRYIFINQNLSESDMRLVMAHEVGHAILHRKQNCYFIRNKTFFSMSKIENEANTFVAELLIPDELISDNPGLTADQVARLAGYNAAIMKFKKNTTGGSFL